MTTLATNCGDGAAPRAIPFDTTDFRVELDADGIAHVILGAPGAMPVTDARGHAELARVWRVLDADERVRAILVRSVGKGFCAGGTPELVAAMVEHQTDRLRVMREARELVIGMIDCDKPIVSAINGAAVGAGLAVALLADISVAARGAKLIDGHTKLGLAAGDHAVAIWPLLTSMARAKDALLLCDTLTGEQAERIGLVSRCVEADALDATALGIAQRLAASSPTAIAWTKRTLNHWLRAALPAFEHSLALEILGFAGADVREGLAALNERRAPAFGRVPD